MQYANHKVQRITSVIVCSRTNYICSCEALTEAKYHKKRVVAENEFKLVIQPAGVQYKYRAGIQKNIS
jgi:hypothetical protein